MRGLRKNRCTFRSETVDKTHGHVYQMAVRDRVRAKPGYCPYCSGRKRPERPIRLG